MHKPWHRPTVWISGLGALLLCMCVLIGTASAQDEMTFGEEEVIPVKDASPVGKFLEEGDALYGDKKYRLASLMYHKVMQEPDASADQHKLKAQYELAKSLYRLDIYQGALNQFEMIVDAGPDHPYYTSTLSWLMLLSNKLPGDPMLLDRIGRYQALYPDGVPEKFRDQLAYLLGRHFYVIANLPEAQKYFSKVSDKSTYFAEAKFLEGITHVRQYQAKPAVNAFKRVLAYIDTVGTDDPKLAQLEQLTLMSMARTFYSVGQYDKAIKYYDFIPQNSPYWLDALFEESWAYFQVDNFNKALGNLHTLNAPFFDDEYFPESMILTAVVFFTNCDYDRTRYIIKEEFDQVYPPLQKELEEYLGQYEDPTEFYSFLIKINKDEGDYDPRLSRILNAALTDETLKRTIGYVDELERELKVIQSSNASWRDSDLGQQLFQDLTVTKSFALSDAGGLARSRLERVVTELKDLNKQGKKILIETAKAETNALDQRIRDEQFKGDNKPKRIEDIPVSDEHVLWTFRGEYWKDELGYYLYNIRPQCGR